MRRIPEGRFDELVDAATEVFIQRGYRQTQMADVAEAIGVAKGTVYGYVESKEALFELCLRNADHKKSVPVPEGLPLKTPAKGQLGREIRARVAASSITPLLAEALKRERADDPRAELEALVRENFQLLEDNHRAIKLLDRCHDHPQLAGLWQEVGRRQNRDALGDYIRLRVAAGQFRPVPSVRLAARMVVEVLATWAIHIHWDRAPERFDPTEARENAVSFIVHGLIPDPISGG